MADMLKANAALASRHRIDACLGVGMVGDVKALYIVLLALVLGVGECKKTAAFGDVVSETDNSHTIILTPDESMKKLLFFPFLALQVFVSHPLFSASILRVPAQSQLKSGGEAEATNQTTRRTFPGIRLDTAILAPGNGGGGGLGPWNGNFVGWKKRGHVWFKIVHGGNAFLGGIDPVPGEVWREVRWAGGEEAIVVVHIKSGRTLILTGKVKEST